LRFKPVAAFATPEYMERLHERFRATWAAGEIERPVLIAAYVLDFLCVHPFHDGNGRMARLLTLLLLYHCGYEVGRYISLERVVEQSKESYYETLLKSSQGWHEGRHDLLPWTEYFIGVVTAAYRELEERAGSLTAARGAKTEMVLEAIRATRGDFSVKELQERCPHVGIDLIRRILREERQAGRVECLGRGPEAKWRNAAGD
jgi:Fic family protein